MDTRTLTKSLTGARKLVLTCLGLLPGQELLIFADETTLEAAQLVHQAATEQQVHSTILLIPKNDQVQIARHEEFPLVVLAAMRDAKAIVICVSDQPEAMNFRTMIIRAGGGFQTKIASCPGMSVEMLATAVDVDYPALVSRCHLIALALVRCHTMKIITTDNVNRTYELCVSLGRWDRVPVASTGIIEEGVWGNIPSGETYLAPLEHTAEGEIIINGSIPGHVFPADQEIKLTFRGGELVRMDPADHAGAQLLQARLDAARSAGDLDCHRLAEVGIGANPGIENLTGKPLMDEKKAGSAHIAIGNNQAFGGSLDSSVHLDLVTEAPTITADGKPILQQGQLVVRESDWRENHMEVEVPEEWSRALQAVSRTGHKANPRSPRLLQRELIDGSGRVLNVSVGDNLTATAAMSLYNCIPSREPIRLAELEAETGWDPIDILKLLKVMRDYDMVKLHGLST